MLKRLSRFFRRPRNSEGNVYYVKLLRKGEPYYLLGLTKEATVAKGLASSGMREECSLEEEYFFSFRDDAWDIEQDVLDYARKNKIVMKSPCGFFVGATDPIKPIIFSSDVLGLDDTLYELSSAAKDAQKEGGVGCLFIVIGLVSIPFTAGISLAVILVVLGGFALYEFVSKHGDEIDEKKRPLLPKKLGHLVMDLSKG